MNLLVIKHIIDLIKEIPTFYNFLKRKKLLKFKFLFLVSIFLLSTYFFWIEIINNNQDYLYAVKQNKLKKEINSILMQCGDKTSISIGAISIEEIDNFHLGEFVIAKACDKLSHNDCLVDLQEHNSSLYNSSYRLDKSSYDFIKESSNFPKYLNLRNEDNQQDLNILAFNQPSIKWFLEQTEWFRQGILNDLYITSTVGLLRGEKIRYVLTLMQAEGHLDNSKCKDKYLILNNLKKIL